MNLWSVLHLQFFVNLSVWVLMCIKTNNTGPISLDENGDSIQVTFLTNYNVLALDIRLFFHLDLFNLNLMISIFGTDFMLNIGK